MLDLLNPYFWAISFRNFLFDKGILPVKRLSIPVISIGNLSSGGTGKTSLIRYLAENLSKSFSLGILLRGYKRKGKGYRVVLERGKIKASLETAGDEAYMLAYLFKERERVSVAVCEDRALGGERMQRELGINLLLLDDAFQHRWLARDLDLVLLKKKDLEDRLLPFGRLREPLSSLKRAHAIILTYQEVYPFDFTFEDKPVFKVFRKGFRIFNSEGKEVSPSELPPVIAFSGLGFNEQFKKILETLKIPLKTFLSLPDHYDYKDFTLKPQETYLTTLKDFLKLPRTPNLYYLDFEIEIEGLLEFIQNSLEFP